MVKKPAESFKVKSLFQIISSRLRLVASWSTTISSGSAYE